MKWSIVGAVLIVVMLLAVVPGMLSSPQKAAEEQQVASVAKRPDCPADQVAGIALPCLGGNGGNDTEQPQRATVVNVWAWWCGPCRKELPLFDALASKHPELNVVGVHADGNAANGAAMLNDLQIGLPSYQDNTNSFAGTLQLPSVVPITVMVRPDGTVAKSFPKTFSSVDELERAIQEAGL